VRILVSSLVAISLYANFVDIKGNLGFEYKRYFDTASPKVDSQKAITGELEITKGGFFTKVELLRDSQDIDRRYMNIEELYYKYSADYYDISIGKSVKFWGALELYNVTDIFNEKNILDDITDKDKKLGALNITYSKFFDSDDELTFIAKLYNQKQEFVYQKSPLYTLPRTYNKEFESEGSKDRPTYYIKYSGSRDDMFKRDFSIVVMSGYDSYRDMVLRDGELRHYLYKANKFLTYHTLVKDSTMYKVEFAYTDVKEYTKIDDYKEYGLGIEHTLYGIWGERDLGVMAEYYKNSINRSDIVYQDDLFYGVRLTFNDKDDSDIVAGVIRDFDSNKDGYSIEYNSRIKDRFKTKLRYLKSDTIEVAGVEFGWYF
jgi:hypothetical protein